ncbi:MAG: hypothetical protein R6V14_03280 [Halanaerobiales bacterium]
MGKHKKRSPTEKLEIVLEALQNDNFSGNVINTVFMGISSTSGKKDY